MFWCWLTSIELLGPSQLWTLRAILEHTDTIYRQVSSQEIHLEEWKGRSLIVLCTARTPQSSLHTLCAHQNLQVQSHSTQCDSIQSMDPCYMTASCHRIRSFVHFQYQTTFRKFIEINLIRLSWNLLMPSSSIACTLSLQGVLCVLTFQLLISKLINWF